MILETVIIVSCPEGDYRNGLSNKAKGIVTELGANVLSEVISGRGTIVVAAKEDRLMMDSANILIQSIRTSSVVIEKKSRIGLAYRLLRTIRVVQIVKGFSSKTKVLVMICRPELSLRLQSETVTWLPDGVDVKFY